MFSQSSSEQHEMHLEKTHESGLEEWYCPTCGRRFLVSWQPAFKRIMLEPGDEYALHNGSKGGLQMLQPQLEQGQNEPAISDELRDALDDALADIDFDDWPDIPQ